MNKTEIKSSARETVRENLVRLRKQNKYTQIELAERIAYSDKAISRWETGEVTPDIDTLEALARLYGVPITDFFVRESEAKREREKARRRYLGRKLATALLVIACVWYVVIILFIRMNMDGESRAWLAFIWALPVTFFISMIFNIRWGKSRLLTFVFCSLLCWTTILSFYLQFLKYNMFMLFPSGAPLQAVIVLWAFVKPAKHEPSAEE